MKRVGIKALKDGLSAYVKAAASGETIQVTDREQVVAALVPWRPRQALTDEELTEMGVREGWLTPATRRGPLPPPVGLPHIPLEQILADLAKDREDR